MVTARKPLTPRDFQSSGFTIVEFLVVFAITAVIIGFAIPAFNSFNRTQLLKTAAAELKTNLRQAQSKALSGEKACNPTDQFYMSLLGWYVHFDPAYFSYTIAHHCIYSSNSLEDTTEYSPKTYTMRGISVIDLSPSNLAYILFEPVSKGVSFYEETAGNVSFSAGNKLPNSVATVTITLTNVDGNSYTVKVNRSGEITDEKIP